MQFTTAKSVCMNVSLNMSSQAQKVRAWNSAHPGLLDKIKQGSKIYSALKQCSSQLQKQSGQTSLQIQAFEYIRCASGMAHTFSAGMYIIIFLVFLWFFLELYDLENVMSCSVSQCVHHTLRHPCQQYCTLENIYIAHYGFILLHWTQWKDCY